MHSLPNDHAAYAILSALALVVFLFAMHTMGETTGAVLYLGGVML